MVPMARSGPKMQVTLVVWDHANESAMLALGFSIQEIEDVLRNHANDTRLADEMDGSVPMCVTVGVAGTGRRIAVKCAFVCGNPVQVYPITASVA